MSEAVLALLIVQSAVYSGMYQQACNRPLSVLSCLVATANKRLLFPT